MFGFFKKKDESTIKEEVQKSFDAVKEDFNKVGQWISHFDGNDKQQNEDIGELKQQIFVLQNEIDDIKDFISLFGTKISKQQQPLGIKQTIVSDVQSTVQTAVQTSI